MLFAKRESERKIETREKNTNKQEKLQTKRKRFVGKSLGSFNICQKKKNPTTTGNSSTGNHTFAMGVLFQYHLTYENPFNARRHKFEIGFYGSFFSLLSPTMCTKADVYEQTTAFYEGTAA